MSKVSAEDLKKAISEGNIEKFKEIIGNFNVNEKYTELGCDILKKKKPPDPYWNESWIKRLETPNEFYCFWHWSKSSDPSSSKIIGLLSMYLEVESKSYGDNIPWTPLMLAAALGRKEIIEFLLTYKGIDISIKDSTGRTALEISRDGIHCDRKVYPECLKKFQEENSIVVQQQQPQQKNDEPSAKQTAAVIVSLSEQLKVAQEQIEKQQSENATLTKSLSEAKEHIEKQQSENATLTKSLSEAKEHIEKQQSENATLTQSLSEAKGQNQSIQEEFDHFKKLAGDFRGFLALITKDISERVEKESQTQTTLLERQKTLETILQQLYTEKDQIEKGMQLIKINDEKLSGWLDANSKVDVEKDLLLGVLDDLALQVLELQAEDRAIEDLFYYLDKQIQEGGIDVDVFLATIRELAKRQFMAKTLLKEIQNI